MVDKIPIKWRQRPEMNTAVDWDVKHHFKQSIKNKWETTNLTSTSRFRYEIRLAERAGISLTVATDTSELKLI